MPALDRTCRSPARLSAGLYNDKGRIILFFATLVVIVLITATLLRWIEQLGKFGRVGDSIMRVEKASIPAIASEGNNPRIGALPPVAVPGAAVAIFARESGYVEYIDVAALDQLAEPNGARVFIVSMPGALVHPMRPLFHVEPSLDEETCRQFRQCVSIGNDSEFEQDPRFGLMVLSEIASRALSPAVNDPGTAITVLASGLRVLLAYADARDDEQAAKFRHVHAPDFDIDALFGSFFDPIARDGCSLVEVQTRLLVVLEALAARSPNLFGAAAAASAVKAVGRSSLAMTVTDDKIEMARCAKWALSRSTA